MARAGEPEALLPYVQLDFTYALGPEPGRYPVHPAGNGAAREPDLATGVTMGRGEADVLILSVVGAERPIERATMVWASLELPDVEEAQAWVDGAAEAAVGRGPVAEAVEIVNTAIRAHRNEARDPYVSEITEADAREVRVGAGTPEQLNAGEGEIVASPARDRPHSGDSSRLRPTESVARALAGGLSLFEGEEHVLRALLDLDRDRPRAAALEARAAVLLLAQELPDGVAGELQAEAGELERLACAADPEPAREGAIRVVRSLLRATADWRDHAVGRR